MVPFNNLINRDGLSNSYTDQMYRYAPRPTCSVELPTCGSKYLFCDTRGYPHCVAKIKLGGLCGRFQGFDACYNGQCIFGRCMPGPTPPPFRPPQPTTTPAVVVTTPTPVTRSRPRQVTRAPPKPFVDCFNRNPCCESWASRGECTSNAEYMKTYCQAACHICNPSYNTTNECTDRHVSCQQWTKEGECRGSSQMFMRENCRNSCHWCSIKKGLKCTVRPTVRFSY